MRPFKRTDIKSDYYYIHVRGKRVCTFLTDYRAACLWVKQQERKAADPAIEAAQRATLGQALELRLAQARRDDRTEDTLSCYAGKIKAIEKRLGSSMPLSNFNARIVDGYIDARRADGVSRHTVSKELRILRSALVLAKRSGLLPGDIDTMFPASYDAGYKPRERTLTHQEAQAIIAPRGAGSEAIAFMLGTGARLGESLRHQPGDVDWGRCSVLVRGTKGARFGMTHREIPITSITEPYLRRAGDFVPPAGETTVRNVLRERCVALGIPHVSANDLRRTFATWHRDAGVRLEHLAPMMGHKTTRMLELVYARLTPDALIELLGRYEAVAYVKTVEKGEGRESCEQQKTANKTQIQEITADLN